MFNYSVRKLSYHILVVSSKLSNSITTLIHSIHFLALIELVSYMCLTMMKDLFKHYFLNFKHLNESGDIYFTKQAVTFIANYMNTIMMIR